MSDLENPEMLPTALSDIFKELSSQYKSLKDCVVANYRTPIWFFCVQPALKFNAQFMIYQKRSQNWSFCLKNNSENMEFSNLD